jgi:Family of unknown function (DUF5941)
MDRMITAGSDARQTGSTGVSLRETLDHLPRRLTEWAMSRSLAPNSVSGISLALAVCAAGWFSAGTRPDSIKGVLAIAASYLAARVAWLLARPAADGTARPGLAGAAMLAEICGAASEFAVLAGLAVAGYTAHWGNTWIVAIAVVIVLAVRWTIVACRGAEDTAPPPAVSDRAGAGAQDEVTDAGEARAWGAGYVLGRAFRGLLAISPGWRLAVIAVAVPIWGAHTTLLVLLDWAIIATGFAIAGPLPRHGPAAPAPTAGPAVAEPTVAELATAGPAPAEPELADSVLADPVLAEPAVAELALAGPAPAEPVLAEPVLAEPVLEEPVLEEPVLAESLLSESAGVESTMTLDQMIHTERAPKREPKPRPAVDPRRLEAIATCRDDGATAVWLGQLVRGHFVPLPPAVAGLVATCLLAVLGLRNLPGILLLTPLVVMLLAAPGISHPHDGRVDWLVPGVLLTGQFIYVAALGFSFRIPAAVTFALCAAIALRYLNLATRDPEAGQIPDTRLGWEGRMLLLGLGAMFGIGMIAYLAMTAYLGVLICGNVMAGCLDGRGENVGDRDGARGWRQPAAPPRH